MPLILLVIVLVLALIPISIVQRFRRGMSQQPARKWVMALNLLGIGISATLFLVGAFITSRWIPGALTYSLAGLAVGGALGILGTYLIRWEYSDDRLHYTPNRWLVTGLMLLVTGRVLYGFWRGWEAWRASLDSATWIAASGVAGSMWAGAVVLGYYLIFWTGVLIMTSRRRLRA